MSVIESLGPQTIDNLIRAIQRAWPEIIGDTHSPQREAFAIRQLHGQGATSRHSILHVTDCRGVVRSFFVKRYGLDDQDDTFWQEQLERDFTVSRVMADLLAKSPYFRVPEPYLAIPEERILVSRYICGNNLSALFGKKLRFSLFGMDTTYDLRNITNKIGKGLAAMQEISIAFFKDFILLPTWSNAYDASIRQFEQAASFLEERGLHPKLIAQSRSFLRTVLRDYFKNYHTPCIEHSDFILQNFIMDSKGILYLFDFPNANIGTPYMDAAHFVGSLEDITYLRSVSENLVNHLISIFFEAVWAKRHFEPEVFTAFSIVIQFRSTMIILLANWRGNYPVWKRYLLENPEKRFKRKVTNYLGRAS